MTTTTQGAAQPSAVSHMRSVDFVAPPAHNAREVNILFATVGCTDPRIVDDLLPRIAQISDTSVRAILDTSFSSQDFVTATRHCLTQFNIKRHGSSSLTSEDIEKEAAELCEWANILVLAPIDANTLAKMLNGTSEDLLLEILRSWNVSKKILLVPGMSTLMWENPMTKKQLTKIRKKWNWVSVLQPVLWRFVDGQKKIKTWKAAQELVETLHNQVDLANLGEDMLLPPSQRDPYAAKSNLGRAAKAACGLPPELWTMIFDLTADWELAQHMHVYTNLLAPPEWAPHVSERGPSNYMETLELTILRGKVADVKQFIATFSVPRWLSKMCIKVILRFAITPLLAYFEAEHPDLFWTTFGHTFLPNKASAVVGRTEVLEFWRMSPSFLTKEYTVDALDGASKAGYVNVLQWWQHSGLPLKFSEAAMEQASAHGHIAVLEWWRSRAASTDDSPTTDANRLRLKPGKSICFATQNGHVDVVRWWVHSGIAFPHEDTVAKLASTHGHVAILQLWYELKGSKIIFDNQVLVGATKNGHASVLEWWKQCGLKVEYKTCDVEEALEDGHEGEIGMQVRRWWARNGLNLGVGTSEWMKTKVLNAWEDRHASGVPALD